MEHVIDLCDTVGSGQVESGGRNGQPGLDRRVGELNDWPADGSVTPPRDPSRRHSSV